MKAVFMGTPDFAVPVLRALHAAGIRIPYVVTQPDRKGNRGRVTFSPVKQEALDEGVPVLQPGRLSADEAVKEKIRAAAPDVIIVVAYGQILKRDVLDIPRLGCYNVHASLLPKLRGASPVQNAVLSGEPETGVTVMRMDEGLDDGDIVAAETLAVGRHTSGTLSDALASLGASLLVRTLPAIEAGTAVLAPQNDEEATYCSKIRKEDGAVDFSEPADVLERRIRAYDPWPGSFCDLIREGREPLRVKFWSADAGSLTQEEERKAEEGAAPGTVLSADGNGIRILADASVLAVRVLQPAGKKRMACADFLLGHPMDGARFARVSKD